MNALLHVEKEKGVEVLFSPSLQDAFCIVGPITVDSRLTSITVSGYSKDENILNGSISKSKLEISCVPKAFCQYLFDRKKAGVMKFGDIVLYVLPPKNRTDLILSCISPTPSSKLSKASQGVASSSSSSSGVSSDQNGKSSSTTNSKNIPSAPAPVPTAVKGDDFLSSLLNKVITSTLFEGLTLVYMHEIRLYDIEFIFSRISLLPLFFIFMHLNIFQRTFLQDAKHK